MSAPNPGRNNPSKGPGLVGTTAPKPWQGAGRGSPTPFAQAQQTQRPETPIHLRRVQLSPRDSPHGSPTPLSRPNQLRVQPYSAEENAFQPLHSPSRQSPRPVSWAAGSPVLGSPVGLGSFEWGYAPDLGEPSTAEIVASQSQDYVDEKLAEFQATIHHLQDEQERVQKKTFVNWINSYLSKRVPPLRIDNLIEDLKDGTRLIALLEVLSGEKLPVEKGRNLRRPHFLSNANTALKFLQGKRIKLVNINASDVVDGRPAVVLGLIWTIILYFQIEENTRVLEQLGQRLGGSTVSLESVGRSYASNVASERMSGASSPITAGSPLPMQAHRISVTEKQKGAGQGGAKKAMLQWVQNTISKQKSIEVNDFGSSWRDGCAFVALVNAIRPGTVDTSSLANSTSKTRLETAFRAAETHLGIARLLDAEDVDVPRPDEKSVMTYVAQFLHRYPDPSSVNGVADSVSAIEKDYQDLTSWLTSKNAYLQQLQSGKGFPLDYNEYKRQKEEVEDHCIIYERLRSTVEIRHDTVAITPDVWRQIETGWQRLETQIRHWQWLLDTNLPGVLGSLGEWLHQAEALLTTDDTPTALDEESATTLSMKIEEHKSFFKELPAMTKRFSEVKSCLTNVPAEQMQQMAARFEVLPERSAQRAAKLNYLEHKCCIVAFLHLTESKLRAWTVKYGREDKIVQLLEQYRSFVSRNKIFQEFEKAYQEMQQVADEYRKVVKLDSKDVEDIIQFTYDSGERWRIVSTELRCVQTMLEEVLAYWRRWTPAFKELSAWLEKAQDALSLQDDERLEFFQDLGSWKEKYQLFTDTSTFLAATCENSVAKEVHDNYVAVVNKWETLFMNVQHYLHAGEIKRNRRDYQTGADKIDAWIVKADELISGTETVNQQAFHTYGNQLQTLQNELDEMDNLWKNSSRKFQQLIPELMPEELTKMNEQMKKQKEALIRIRATIPTRMQLCHQISAQQEALDIGIRDLTSWITDAEALLELPYGLGGQEALQQLYERHQGFFSRMLYYKSMLDSLNKIFHSIIKALGSSGGADTGSFKHKMIELESRMQRVVNKAQQRELTFMEGLRCWQNYQESLRAVNAWLQTAESLAGEKTIDSKQAMEMHKTFFGHINDRLLEDLRTTASELKRWLPEESPKLTIKEVEDRTQKRWDNIVSFAPLHLMRLEFRIDEETFYRYVRDVEKELTAQQLALSRQENGDTILRRHMDFFNNGPTITSAEQTLDRLTRIVATFRTKDPDDPSLEIEYNRVRDIWSSLLQRISTLSQQLQAIPQQWSEYETRFNEMCSWMDSIENSIKALDTEVLSLADFEVEKGKFQESCRDIEKRRDGMKWLVQQLDSLVSHKPEADAIEEQLRLERLITRYKALIQDVDAALGRYELLSKCYLCNEEICQTLHVLEEIQTRSARPVVEGKLESLSQELYEQEEVVKDIENRRTQILALLQRGKNLQRDPASPEFLRTAVQKLEGTWNEAHRFAIEKLRLLKGWLCS